MAKRKRIIYFLIFITIILCMMNIYLQRQLNNTYIAYNTADRELAMLKMDYEKLYNAYYAYDDKILKIVSTIKNVYWAKDSSVYIIVNDSNILFSFFKKPKMENEFHLWSSVEKKANKTYIDLGRVDTLKPHQYFSKPFIEGEKVFWVSQVIQLPKEDKPGLKMLSTIYIK